MYQASLNTHVPLMIATVC